MITWIQTHLLAGGLSALGLAVVFVAKHWGPSLARKYAGTWLTAAANPDITDPEDKADVTVIIKASMRIAARRMGSAAGTAKMNWVVDYVCAKTSMKREDVACIAQGVYDAFKDELKVIGNAADPAPVAPAAPPAANP